MSPISASRTSAVNGPTPGTSRASFPSSYGVLGAPGPGYQGKPDEYLQHRDVGES